MHEGNLSNSGYRIKKRMNNFLEEPRPDDDPLKISIHSSSHKSPNKNSRNPSLGHRYLEKLSQRNKKSQSNLNTTNSNFSSKQRPQKKNRQIVEFTNVKQLLMISAYDKKLLRNVTTSSEANQKFLRLGDVRKDPYRRQTYKVLIEEFKEWVKRIRDGYSEVLNIFLSQNTNKSAIVTLGSVKPLLEEVKYQASMMHSRVKDCQETQDYREFRPLLLRFDTFLQAAKGFEDIIYIVNQSKNKIDDLFQFLEKDSEIDKKVDKERRRGLKKVRRAVQDYGDDNIQNRILGKVQSAINEMADKTLQAYSKIKGVRGLMYRIKDCLADNKAFYDLEDIIKINEIFKETMWEASQFQAFSDRFMEEGDLLNDDLKSCIIKYREEMAVKKEAICFMEVKFIINIIQTLVQSLQANYSACNAIDSTLCVDYVKIEQLLESICEIISDQNVKSQVKVMLKDSKPHFRQIQRLINSLQETQKVIVLDHKEGYNSLVELYENMTQFKDAIKAMVMKAQRAYKKIANGKKLKKQDFTGDLEIEYLEKVLELSKKMNKTTKKQAIAGCSALLPLNRQLKLASLAEELGSLQILTWCKKVNEEYQEICSSNQIGTILEEIAISSPIYDISGVLLSIHSDTKNTTQSNLIAQAERIKGSLKKKKQSSAEIFDYFYERCICLLVCKGFENRLLKILDDTSEIKFPETQHDIESLRRDIRYFTVIKNSLPNCLVSARINNASEAMKQVIQGVQIAENLKWNKDQQYYLSNKSIFEFVQEAFQRVFYQKESFNVKRIIQNLNRLSTNLNKLEQTENKSGNHEARVQKVCHLIHKYREINTCAIKRLTEQVQVQDSLQVYSQVVFAFGEYLQETTQSYHATLGKNKNIIWICEDSKDNPKESLLAKKIGFHELKAGQFVSKCNQKEPALSRKKKPEPKPQKTKEKPQQKKQKNKKDLDDMEEEIGEFQEPEDEMADQMEDNIEEMDDEMEDQLGDQIPDDGMADQMNEEMDQEMGDDMPDEMEDDIPDDDMEDEIPDDDIGDQMGDQIGDEFEFSDEKKKKEVSKINEKLANKKQFVRPQSAIKGEKPKMEEKQPQKKAEQKIQIPDATIKQKTAHKIYQIFKFAQTLEDLLNLIQKISSLAASYWSQANFKKLESYFNYQSRDSIAKEQIADLDKYCNTIFSADIALSAKKSQQYQKVLQQIQALDCLKLKQFIEILTQQHKKFGYLLGKKGELLRLSIQSNEQWKASDAIKQYVKKQLNDLGLKSENLDQDFELEGYKKQLLKQRNNFQTKYEISDEGLQPNIEELKKRINRVSGCVESYKDMSKFPDGLDLGTIITKMWVNCLVKEQDKEEYTVPEKLNIDISNLEHQLNQADFLHYVTAIKDMSKIVDQLKQHRKSIAQIINKNGEEDLLENIKKLTQIYSCDTQNLIKLDEEPIFIKNQKTQMQEKNKQIQKILNMLLVPESKDTFLLTSSAVRNAVSKHFELYVDNPEEISKILSLLEIEAHILPAETTLQVHETQDEIVASIVSQVTDKVIKNPQEDLDNISEVLDSLKIKCSNRIIWEYTIKEDSMLSIQNNRKFHSEYLKVSQLYKQRKQPPNISRCLIESVLGMQETQSSATSSVLEYIDSLADLLRAEVFSSTLPYKTVYTLHVDIQNNLGSIMQQISEENSLLDKIIDPINIHPKVSSEECLQQIEERNKIVLEWYEKFRNMPANNLSALHISLNENQEQSEKEKLLYLSESSNLQKQIQSLLKLFLHQSSPSDLYKDFIKKHLRESNSQNYKSSQTLRWQCLFQEINLIINDKMVGIFSQFLERFNEEYFLKGKGNKAKELRNEIMTKTENQVKILKLITKQILVKLPDNRAAHALFLSKISDEGTEKNMASFSQLCLQKEGELTYIRSVNFDTYNAFGVWVVQVMSKVYQMDITILMDKFSPENMVCILASFQEEKIKQSLVSINLPTDFQLQEKKHFFQKIKLKEQNFSVKLSSEITAEEIAELEDKKYGYQEPASKTVVLGFYQKSGQKQEEIIGVFKITPQLLTENKSIDVSINKSGVSLEIACRLIQSKVTEQDADGTQQYSFLTSLFEEKYDKIYLGQQVQMKGISRQLKKMHGHMLEQLERRKKEQQTRFLLEQQRLKEEQQRKKRQEEERIKREQEEQEQRKREQQERLELERKAQIERQKKAEVENKKEQQEQYIAEFLDQLYDGLAKKHLYSIQRGDIKINDHEADEDFGDKIKSYKNLELRDATIGVLEETEDLYEGAQKNDCQIVTDAYLKALEKFIMKRQLLFETVLEKARNEQNNANQELNQENSLSQMIINKVLNEMKDFPTYDSALDSSIRHQLNKLSKQDKSILLI